MTPSAGSRRLQVALLFALVVSGRWALAAGATIPQVAHDEHAQLAIARVMGRAGSWTMADIATWQPGFGLLVAPLAALIDDPEQMYRAVLVVNCLIGGLGAIVFARLVRAIVPTHLMTYSLSNVLAAIVTLSPALIRTSALSWSEPSVFLMFTATLLGLVEIHRSGQTRWAVLAVLAAPVGYLFHGRLLPIALLTVPMAAWLVGRGSPIRAAALASAGISSIAAVQFASAAIVDRIWTQPRGLNTVGATLSRLKDPAQVGEAFVGQFWYQQTSSLGLFAIGAVVLVGASLRRSWASQLIDPPIARLVALLVTASVATSALFMSGRDIRADYPIYGRYNDSVSGIVIVIGVVLLLRLARTGVRRYVTAIAVSYAALFLAMMVTDATSGGIIRDRPMGRNMVTGLAPFVIGPPRDLLAVSLASATVAFAVFLAIGRFWRAPVALTTVAMVLVAVGGIRVWDVFEHSSQQFSAIRAAVEVEEIVPKGLPIGVELTTELSDGVETFANPRTELSSLQFFLPDRKLVPVRRDEDPLEYTFGVVDSPTLENAGGEVVWLESGVYVVLWHIPRQNG